MEAITMQYSFTDKEIKQLLASMVMLVDSREQENGHITEYMKAKHIPYQSKKLDYGDYGAFIPSNGELGIARDLYFPMAIERKNSVDELASSIKDRSRFEHELIRSHRSSFLLLVEDKNGYENMVMGNYRSQYQAKALLASLKTFESRYNFRTVFIDKKMAGNYLYHHFYYAIRDTLKY